MKTIAGGALLLAAVLAAVWMLRPDRAVQPDPPAVLARVRELNELSTVKYTIQKVVGLKEPKQPVGEESILLAMQASVTAGIDLSSMGPKQVEMVDDTLTIRLPEPRILSVAIDEKETKVWDRRKTWWTPWVPYSPDLEQRARLEGIDAVRRAALEMGILRQAEVNAEKSIRSLLRLAGVKKLRIVPERLS